MGPIQQRLSTMQVLLQTLLATVLSCYLALEPVVVCKVLILPLLLYLQDDRGKMNSGMQPSAAKCYNSSESTTVQIDP